MEAIYEMDVRIETSQQDEFEYWIDTFTNCTDAYKKIATAEVPNYLTNRRHIQTIARTRNEEGGPGQIKCVEMLWVESGDDRTIDQTMHTGR